MGARENKLQKIQISQNEILCTRMTILPVFYQIPVKFWNFIFSSSYKNLIFGVISYNLFHL